jgi:hypothetical protein
MSLEQLGSKSYALRNLWEATLFDEKHNPMDWTTGLMVSTNIPKLKLIVEPILAGSSKGYKGWELPDSLSITMRETTDHSLEKYLDEWMMGKSGVFNPETGAFRVQATPDFLYRDIKVRTFYYKFISGENINVKIHEAIQRGAEKIVEITGGETVNAKQWKAEEVTTSLVTYTCAIESYDIGTYDYQTGEGVQYTISLPVCDIKIEHEAG